MTITEMIQARQAELGERLIGLRMGVMDSGAISQRELSIICEEMGFLTKLAAARLQELEEIHGRSET